MGIPRITVDTHTLVWFVDETLKMKKLSALALETIREAERNGIIYISAISLMEVIDLAEKGRISISFQKVLSAIKTNDAYIVIPVSDDLINTAISLKGLEIHDRLIVATAIMTNSVLVSKDREIRATGLNVLWSKQE
jgi:PIN domain nuclease of toxin-antitoxin system